MKTLLENRTSRREIIAFELAAESEVTFRGAGCGTDALVPVTKHNIGQKGAIVKEKMQKK